MSVEIAASTSTTAAAAASAPRPIPAGLTPYTEQSTTILLPDDNTAFLNPVQQFNRDLSVAVISTWAQVWREDGRAEWEAKMTKKYSKGKGKSNAEVCSLQLSRQQPGNLATRVAALTCLTLFMPPGLNFLESRLSAKGVCPTRGAVSNRSPCDPLCKGDPGRQVRDRERPVADGREGDAAQCRVQRHGCQGHGPDR